MASTLSDSVPNFGSVGWANWLLRAGIHVLRDETDRVPSARVLEVLCTIELLKQNRYPWQTKILRSHLHARWHLLYPEGPIEESVLRPSQEGRSDDPGGEEGLQ
jgi:hypothetical protein